MAEYSVKYVYTVSVFFKRENESSHRNNAYRCKECGRSFVSAKEAKDHFSISHETVLQRYAALGYIRQSIKTKKGTHPLYAHNVIRQYRDEILRKIDREDLLEVLK
jgi:hypothetical protein